MAPTQVQQNLVDRDCITSYNIDSEMNLKVNMQVERLHSYPLKEMLKKLR